MFDYFCLDARCQALHLNSLRWIDTELPTWSQLLDSCFRGDRPTWETGCTWLAWRPGHQKQTTSNRGKQAVLFSKIWQLNDIKLWFWFSLYLCSLHTDLDLLSHVPVGLQKGGRTQLKSGMGKAVLTCFDHMQQGVHAFSVGAKLIVACRSHFERQGA